MSTAGAAVLITGGKKGGAKANSTLRGLNNDHLLHPRSQGDRGGEEHKEDEPGEEGFHEILSVCFE